MKKVLVIGESCSNVIRYGKCVGLCPEAPVPIFLPTRTTNNGGMSINVHENLKSLGIECDLITNDIRPVVTRYVEENSNQLLLRVDEKEVIESICAKKIEAINFGKYSAIIICDSNKGYLSEEDIKFICRNHSRVFVDTKKRLDLWCIGAFIIKLNEKESNENLDYLMLNNDLISVIITNGKHGAELNSFGLVELFPIESEHEIRDLSGAGDTFIAGLVANYINSNDICTAIKYANRCVASMVH